MSETKEPLIHLLIPKEFKVWCVNRSPSTAMKITNLPSKATCANCLTKFRTAKTGKYNPYRVSNIPQVDDFRAITKQKEVDQYD